MESLQSYCFSQWWLPVFSSKTKSRVLLSSHGKSEDYPAFRGRITRRPQVREKAGTVLARDKVTNVQPLLFDVE